MKRGTKILTLTAVAFFLMLGSCKSNDKNTEEQSQSESSALTLHQDDNNCESTLDIYSSMFMTIHLKDTIVEKNVDGLSFTATSRDTSGITLSNVQDSGDVNVFSTGVVGDFVIDVIALLNNVRNIDYAYIVHVIDGSPAPEIIKEIPDMNVEAPIFANGKTNYDLVINLEEYIEASDYVSYRMECSDNSVSMKMDGKKATINFQSFGAKQITIKAIVKETTYVTLTFTATLTSKVSNQLNNGGFEENWSGWDADEWDKVAYSIYDSETDIWGNRVNNNGKYLYGYFDESGTCDIKSSLFQVGGIRLITFLLSGNSTEDLQLRLMKYVEGGSDIEITKFNNWYYKKYSGSGFIMRNYFYYVPEQYNGDHCYFEVIDNRVEDFGFVMLDDVITYYTALPSTLNSYYEAGFVNDPSGEELDMSDTSNDPFTPLNQVGYQLPNGDFESGYSHWFMTTADKNAYAIYGSSTDIWGNPVHNTKNYLYGYAKEDYTGTFHSDLFKVGGTGLITFKLAGYHTSDLQFRLVKYVEGGEDVVIERFNNWYCNTDVRDHSGFIMQNYWYFIDLATYQDCYCYFEVYDMKTSFFGFLSIDDIVTYYETNPTMTEADNYFKAGYINDPR